VNLERFRSLCLAFPGATEQIQWGADLVFKVGGKMFAVAATEPSSHVVSFKCSDEGFAELLEQDGVVPAPYLARAKWVALERFDALSDREIQERIGQAYALIAAKLPKSARAALEGGPRKTPSARKTGTARKTRPSRGRSKARSSR
jgi:predicted DNA-binding protein (MmcQ/YjbR family)